MYSISKEMTTDFSQVKNLSYKDLKDIGQKLGFETEIKEGTTSEKKGEIIDFIMKYISRKKKKEKTKYQIMEQIGNTGKEGITYRVLKNKTEYAMKTFKKRKSSSRILKEAELQQKASEADISPKIFDVDSEKKFIVMERMDQHLTDKMLTQNGNLNVSQQKQLIKIFKTLDKIKIFHADSNLLNYMIKDNKIYIIDFGMSKDVDEKLEKKLGTSTPNIDFMTIGFILKLKEFNCPSSSYSHLRTYISPENRTKFDI